MAVRGEKLSPELVERMRVARMEARARKNGKRPAEINDLDIEDVSLPSAPPSVVDEEDTPPPPVGDPADPYNVWLGVLDSETRAIFSDAELRALFVEQRTKAEGEKRVRKKKEITELALSTARSQMGLLPAQKVEALRVQQQNKKPVVMLISMPPAQDDGGPADVGLRVNGDVIANGTRHHCTYGEAASLREMLYRHGQHELLFKGQNMRYRAYLLGQAMGSVNPMIDIER